MVVPLTFLEMNFCLLFQLCNPGLYLELKKESFVHFDCGDVFHSFEGAESLVRNYRFRRANDILSMAPPEPWKLGLESGVFGEKREDVVVEGEKGIARHEHFVVIFALEEVDVYEF